MHVIQTEVQELNPHRYTGWKSRDEELRSLRLQLAAKENGHKKQKKRIEKFEEEIKKLKEQLKDKQEKEKELEEELGKVRNERDWLRGLLFKASCKNKEKGKRSSYPRTSEQRLIVQQ